MCAICCDGDGTGQVGASTLSNQEETADAKDFFQFVHGFRIIFVLVISAMLVLVACFDISWCFSADARSVSSLFLLFVTMAMAMSVIVAVTSFMKNN